jgi:myo-inositol-1(or 4)-monophosphatase
MADKIPLDKLLQAARVAALGAGKILRNFWGKEFKVYHKGEVDLVTEVDLLSEEFIVKQLQKFSRQVGFLAEETEKSPDNGLGRWLIDPLDGTTNFAHGYPCFTVSIAFELEGEIRVGVVYLPLLKELFWAVIGGGSFADKRRLQVSAAPALIQSLLATGFPYDRKTSPDNNLNHFSRLLMAAQEVRRDGSAAWDLCQVAAGRLDGFWELKLKPWDVAAGSLIVKEAGGKISDFKGGNNYLYGGEILSSNGLIHQEMLGIIQAARRQDAKATS